MSHHTQISRRKFLGATAAVACSAQAAASTRPNILFLMSDEHRHDALGCAGNAAIETPNLDRVAGQGVNFTHTYCQGPLCQPSRASIITGQYVHRHGQTWNGFSMRPEWPTLMKQLQTAGYQTAMIGKAHFSGDGAFMTPGSRDFRNHEWSRRFGLDWMLEEFDKVILQIPGAITPYTEYLKSKGLLETFLTETPRLRPDPRAAYAGKVSKLPLADCQSSFIGDRAVDWLHTRKSDQPFFLWVSFVEPHPPIIDNAYWAERYKDTRMPVGPVVMPELKDDAYGRYIRVWIRAIGSGDFTAEGAAAMARHYYGMMSQVDRKIGDIIHALQETGADKNTWIVYTADHGEMLGDHKMVFKNVFYRGSVRVPNIVMPPGGMKPRTVHDLVESIDLTATMLDVAGAELPQCQGRSLVPLIQGRAKGREVAFSELAGHQNKNNFFVMAATSRYRYLYDKQNDLPCELFDLEKDPDELHNLIDDPAHAGIRKDLHRDYIVPFMSS
jgi:arylsulfatase